MNITRNLVSASLACLLGMSASAAMAAGKGTNTDKAKGAASSESAAAVESARTATSLLRYGDANKDALSLITAARILKQTGVSQGGAERTGGKAGDAKGKDDNAAVDAILARAKTYAGARTDLVALADDVAKGGTRGAEGGPKRTTTVVRSRETDTFRVNFRGGEPARVFVSGDGDSDLDLFVYDENGNLICKDDDGTDDMVCGWTPKWTGAFRIRIVNLGVANQYRIWTN